MIIQINIIIYRLLRLDEDLFPVLLRVLRLWVDDKRTHHEGDAEGVSSFPVSFFPTFPRSLIHQNKAEGGAEVT